MIIMVQMITITRMMMMMKSKQINTDRKQSMFSSMYLLIYNYIYPVFILLYLCSFIVFMCSLLNLALVKIIHMSHIHHMKLHNHRICSPTLLHCKNPDLIPHRNDDATSGGSYLQSFFFFFEYKSINYD